MVACTCFACLLEDRTETTEGGLDADYAAAWAVPISNSFLELEAERNGKGVPPPSRPALRS